MIARAPHPFGPSCPLGGVVRALCFLPLATSLACGRADGRADRAFSDRAYDDAANSVREATLSRRIDDLAADSMLGRAPGTRGETLTVAYLEREMRAIGLTPGGSDGYRQPVSLARVRAQGSARFHAGGHTVALDSTAVVFAATAAGEHVVRDAPIVFVGYGIVAPEFGWDDYGDIDLRGKVALILDGEPAIVSGRRFGTRAEQSPHAMPFLKGGHALAHGASAVVLLRSGDDSAHARRRLRLQDEGVIGEALDPAPQAPISLHLSTIAAERLARASGTTFAAWRALAEDSAAAPSELALRLDARVQTDATPFVSYNVIGTIPGSDAARRDECVVYLAHWDAFGIGPAVHGDSIYNGALDDAAGVSQMLLIAQAMRALPRAPRRTMVFVATTAEEHGTRGANAYAAAPTCALERTALAVGMDWPWTWGVTDTVVSNGYGYSTVDSLAREVATRHGKALVAGLGDYWLASDHATLALRGVPAWFGGLDGEVHGKPSGWAAQQLETQESHVPSDERKPTWDLSGALFEVRFLFELGVRAAEGPGRFEWSVDSESRRAATALRRATGAP